MIAAPSVAERAEVPPPVCESRPVTQFERAHRPRRQLDVMFIFIALCCALFAGSVSLRLNGSSSAFWTRALNAPEEPTGLLVGKPRATRSDEWLFWTPAVLSQLKQQPAMPVENLALGAGASPLLMSLPVRHYTMLFRPQLWGFFVFDAERGFSWFWNTKLFGLLIAYGLLFRAVTGGRAGLAIAGAVIVTYSSCVQWFFSSPTMLPEMMSCWAVMLLTARSLFRPRPHWKKIGAAALFIACGANFALSCYPPFQIPLAYLALTLFGAFVWMHRRESLGTGLAWLGATLVITLAVLWPVFLDLRPTLEIVANTSYPGARRGTGGTMSITQLFSGLLNFFDGNRPHVDMYPNTSEASNFFPIWLAAIAGVLWKWADAWRSPTAEALPRSTPICAALVGFILFFSFYAVVGLPEWFCRITALNFVTEKRVLLALALAGFLLTFLTLRPDGTALVKGRTRIWVIPAVITAAVAYFLAAREQNPGFLTPGYCAIYVCLAALLGCLYFCARPIVFAAAFAAALLLNNFLVNPIGEGLPILLRSRAAQQIAAIHKADPKAVWAVYESGTSAQFITACGARVLNGVKTVPNLDLLGRLDPAGSSRDIYNRYAFIAFGLPRPSDTGPAFEVVSGDFYRAFISPFHPALREAGLRYVVFPRLLDPTEAGTMKLVATLPENQLSIYRLPADEAATPLPLAAAN